MEERRISQQELLRTLQEQNAMLAQILSFIAPIAAFFNALKLVTKFAAVLVGIGTTLYVVYDWVKAFILRHP